MRSAIACMICIMSIVGSADAQVHPDSSATFNRYVLAAVKLLAEKRSGLGYGSAYFTQDLKFGNVGVLKASKAPITMCVAAQLEVLVEALDLYSSETGDYEAFHYIPKTSWERMRPIDLKGQIWIVDRAPSNGAADAFANFGLGDKMPFDKLTPGSFLNFNRMNGTGHGVVFLNYLDASGNELPSFSDKVAGFKYFSAQGRGQGSGLGYRFAFFSNVQCPTLSDDRKRDCGVIRSDNQKLLNGGFVRMPKNWDRAKAAEQLLQAGLSAQSGDDAMLTEGQFKAEYFNGITTDD